MQKEETDDIVTYAGKVNALFELFKLKDLSVDMFKCYIFVQGLTAPRDKDLRSGILSIMEQDPEMNLQKVTEKCQKLINVKRDIPGPSSETKNFSQEQRKKFWMLKLCGFALKKKIALLKTNLALNVV